MSVSYTWVGWTRHKKIYDAVLACSIAGYLAVFFGVSKALLPARAAPDDTVLVLRGLGTCAILMLHIVLWIGPLARLDRRLLPLLYNRRHLGVATFLVGLGHATLSVMYYHGFGNVNPLLSVLTANTSYGSLSRFPFEILGLAALVILFLMAATSHDFWLKNLSARVWKSLHMMVYGAYGLLVMHVALGALQSERSLVLTVLMGAGLVVTVGLHLVAGRREVARDSGAALRGEAAGALTCAAALELVLRLEAGIEAPCVLKRLRDLLVAREPVGLARLAIPHEAKPREILADGIGKGRGRAREIGVVEAQHEAAAIAAREEPVQHGRADIADVQAPGRARCEADGNGHWYTRRERMIDRRRALARLPPLPIVFNGERPG